MVQVNIEYCGYCNFQKQCEELSDFIKSRIPDAKTYCQKGRQGAFEVQIDGQLVYSKIQRMAFPEYESVVDNVQNAKEGKPMGKVREQKIDNCSLM